MPLVTLKMEDGFHPLHNFIRGLRLHHTVSAMLTPRVALKDAEDSGDGTGSVSREPKTRPCHPGAITRLIIAPPHHRLNCGS